jgi:multiple sugar transport system ATP-binding protein
MAEVVLENVTKVYPGGIRAVDNLTLTIADREFTVLVGPSGCGKTSTLRMIAGLEEPTSGTIRIGQQIVNQVPPKDRNIAMVFQNYALYPHMTVYQNLAFGLLLRRRYARWDNPIGLLLWPERYRAARAERAEIDRRVRAAATLLGIESLLDRRPAALSGGQRQRVALGRAIVRSPQAFLFDEPLSNLDARLRVEMRAELRTLHRQVQTTTIYVTHDQEEAMTLGDRVVVMKDGRIQQSGTPFEVYRFPVNRFVAGFIGTPPMNFLTGRLTHQGHDLYFDEGDNRLRLCPDHRERLLPWVGQTVLLGIRPEHLLPPGTLADACRLRLSIRALEPLGERMDAVGSTSAHERIVCRLPADTPIREGQIAELEVDMQRVHVFAADDEGRNLTLPA